MIIDILILIAVVYVGIIVTLPYMRTKKVKTIRQPVILDETEPLKRSSRVIPLTDEYEYDKGNEYKNVHR